jgi:long-chain acyl-CoA synthetase
MDAKPWLAHYDQGVPPSLQPYPHKTLVDLVSESARQRPQHTALIFKGARLSYRELDHWTDAFAAALVTLGVQKGDRVALVMPNSPQGIIAQLGAWKAGAIVAPLNPIYTERELELALNEIGAETVVVLTPFYHKIKALQSRTQLHRIIATNIKEYLSPHLRLLFTLAKERKEGHRIALQAGDWWMSDLIKQSAHAVRPAVEVRPEDDALLLFTGGTTGIPKAAIGTHQALLCSGLQIRTWFGKVLDEWNDVILGNMPMFHVYGNAGALALSIVGHNPLAIVVNPRDIPDLLTTIHHTHAAFFPGVPTLFNALINHPDVRSGKVSLRSVKACISGAAPLLAETKHQFEALTGGRIVEGYALTETMMGAAINPLHGTYKVGSVGLPASDIEIRIVDMDESDRELVPGEIGEITIRAPQLMRGYWQSPTETANVLRAGWLYTGDIGYIDEDGYVFITDRKKDLIKPSGYQVWPREVEEVLAAHPAVAEVAVAGVLDEKQGEAVKAWVVLRAGQSASVDELRAYCRERLAPYKVPRQIAFRDSLPKTMVGKVLRRELVKDG